MIAPRYRLGDSHRFGHATIDNRSGHSNKCEFRGYHRWMVHPLGRLIWHARHQAPCRPGPRVKTMRLGLQCIRTSDGQMSCCETRRDAYVEVVGRRLRIYDRYPH